MNWGIQQRDVNMPEKPSELAFYSIAELSNLIRTGKITSTELTRLYLDRLKKYGDTLHCVVTLTEELALEQAARADSELVAGKYRGPLHGIPYGAKDIISQKDYKTTWGAEPYKNQILNETATVIKKLSNAGAVLVAKLSTGALAMGDIWYSDTTRNPWNPLEGSSGSSAGPASATLKTLRKLGAKLIPVEFPDNIPVSSQLIILYSEAAASFDLLTRSNRDSLLVKQDKWAWPNIFRQSRFIPAVEYIQANRFRYLLINEMYEIMKNFDVVVAPSFGGDQLLLTNLTGHPCVVVPNGFNNGSPVSITFIGNLLDEATILAFARKYQEATGFDEKHPLLFAK